MSARRNTSLLVGALSLTMLILAAGCSGTSSTVESTSQAEATSQSATTSQPSGAVTLDQAREAGQVAAAIAAEPNRMQEILDSHGMTAERFETLVYDIAQDPALSAAYMEAKGP